MVVPALNPAQARQPLPSYGLEPVAAAAERCVDKIEQVEEIEYDDVVRNINRIDRNAIKQLNSFSNDTIMYM